MPVSIVSNGSTVQRSLLIVCCLTATLLASTWADHRRPDALAVPLDRIATEITGWSATEEQSLPENLFNTLKPTSYLSRIYRKQDRQLGLFIAYYAQQRAGETLHSPKVCLPGNGWDIVRQGSTTLAVSGKPVTVNQYKVQNSGSHLLVLYWYQSRRHLTASEYLGKLLLIRDALFDGDTSAAIVRVMLPDEGASPRDAARFAEELIPQVQRCLGK